jgi:hypothetical protein
MNKLTAYLLGTITAIHHDRSGCNPDDHCRGLGDGFCGQQLNEIYLLFI